MNKRHYNAALALANKARKKLGRRPVTKLRHGIPEEATCCVIAATIGAGVIVEPSHRGVGRIWVKHDDDTETPIVQGGALANAFALDFDAALYPELIVPKHRKDWVDA